VLVSEVGQPGMLNQDPLGSPAELAVYIT
jgi:hypothetical protein